MLAEKIGYRFQDPGLLKLALTHPSINKAVNNQRLEFLGDAVLGMVVARMLYALYPNEPEGELARRHAALVRGETLSQVARALDLGADLTIAASEARGGGRDTASNLEDALEALIGAMYLDGGIAAAESFIVSRWQTLAMQAVAPPKDAKTALQEWAQARGLPVPTYTLVQSTGPAHAPLFTIEATVRGFAPARAEAAAKRVAEQAAAESLLKTLTEP
jgi:ribonuclease III